MNYRPFRYCPICATELVVQYVFDRERQQCPACGWIHFKGPKVGAGALVEQDGKVILIKRGIEPGKGQWCFPSGFMEYDETPQQAAIREFKEETGFDIAITALVDVFYYDADFRGAGILILYRGRISGGAPTPMDDAAEIRFLGPAELPPADQIAFASNQLALQQWQAQMVEGRR